jgi:hypothetical protein
MPAVTLKAHFNGKQIVLDEPFDLPPDSPLMVTVMSKEDCSEDAPWHSLAAGALARAYGEDEPDYLPIFEQIMGRGSERIHKRRNMLRVCCSLCNGLSR